MLKSMQIMHDLHKLILSTNKVAVAVKREVHWWEETGLSDFCFKGKGSNPTCISQWNLLTI